MRDTNVDNLCKFKASYSGQSRRYNWTRQATAANLVVDCFSSYICGAKRPNFYKTSGTHALLLILGCIDRRLYLENEGVSLP
jgi:hypothetical protein